MIRLSRGEILKEYPARLKHFNGSYRHVLIDSSVGFNSDGSFINTRCFTRDVTEKVLLENKHKEAVIQKLVAEQANQLKSDFLSQMSHDIRTPINGVLGLLFKRYNFYNDNIYKI